MIILKKILTQSAFQLVGKAISSITTLLVLFIIARNYGKEGTGIYTLALTYLAFFYLAVDLGLNAYVLPKLTDKTQASKLYSLRLIISLFLFIIANLLIRFMPFNSPIFSQAVFFGSATIIFYGIVSSTNLIFQSKLRYDLSIAGGIINGLLNLLLVWYLVKSQVAVPYLLLGPLLGWAVGAIIASILVSFHQKLNFTLVNLEYVKSIFKNSWPISLTLILNVVYFRIDSFLISSIHGIASVGVYNLAYQFFQTALVVPTFIMNSFYPLMLKQFEESKVRFLKQFKLVGLVLLGISIFGIILTFALSPFLINLTAGKDFSDSIKILNLLSLGFPAYFISALLMWALVVLKKYRTMFLIYLVGLLVNFLLNLIFIPHYSYFASALITGFSEYLILILQLITLFKFLKK